MKHLKILIFLFLILLCVVSCSENKEKIVYEDTSDIYSSTNIKETIEQENIYLNQEFDEKRYKKVVDFVNLYFKNKELTKNNLKLLFLKATAKEKLAEKLNRKKNKWAYRIAKKYKYKIKKNKIYYDFRDYKIIWKRFPNTSYGKDAFEKYYGSLQSNKNKIKSLESFLSKRDIIDYKIKLFNLYLYEFLKKNNYYKPLTKLFHELKDERNINNERILINYIVALYINKKMDFSNFVSDIRKISNKNNIYGCVANYLLGEHYLGVNKLDTAKEYFLKAKDKKIKKFKIPLVIKFSENIYDLKQLKKNILDKLKLVKAIVKYNSKYKHSTKKGIISGERVRLRSKPQVLRKNVITTLNYGEKVIIITKSSEKKEIENEKYYWYKVELMDNTSGWIFGKYITLLTVY